jgi:hypothetical protein
MTAVGDGSTVQEGVCVDYLPLRPSIKQGKLLVGTETFPELARMNYKAALVLSETMKFAGVQLDIFAERSDLEACSREAGKTTAFKLLHVDAHISGHRGDSESIGRLLSKHGIYLQDPHSPVTRMEYHNPHVLSLDVLDVEIWFLENELRKDQTKDATDWTVALDSLSQQHNLDAAAVALDETIITTPMMA